MDHCVELRVDDEFFGLGGNKNQLVVDGVSEDPGSSSSDDVGVVGLFEYGKIDVVGDCRPRPDLVRVALEQPYYVVVDDEVVVEGQVGCWECLLEGLRGDSEPSLLFFFALEPAERGDRVCGAAGGGRH